MGWDEFNRNPKRAQSQEDGLIFFSFRFISKEVVLNLIKEE